MCGVDVVARGLRELNDRPRVSVDVDAEFIWGLLVESGAVDQPENARRGDSSE